MKPFLSLLFLTLFWSFFFAFSKWFYFGVFSIPPTPLTGGFQIHPTPEQIASFLSLGGVIAYLVGGAIFSRWSRSIILLFCSLLGIVAFWMGYFAHSWSLFTLAVTIIGTTYGMWSISRNSLVSLEIAHGRRDVIVSGSVTMMLIVFLVVGTVIGSRLSGSLDTWLVGGILMTVILLFSLLPLLWLRSESRQSKTPLPSFALPSVALTGGSPKQTGLLQEFRQGMLGMWRVFRRHGVLLVAVSLYWAISTEASNVALISATDLFHQTQAEASFLLLYSSVGAVIGNVISMSLARYRIVTFLFLSVSFLILVSMMGWIFGWSAQSGVSMVLPLVAASLGLLFGAGVNLIESFYFALLGSDPDREYGSSMYGLILSACLFLLMTLAHIVRVDLGGGLTGVSIFLAVVMLIVLFGGFIGLKKGYR